MLCICCHFILLVAVDILVVTQEKFIIRSDPNRLILLLPEFWSWFKFAHWGWWANIYSLILDIFHLFQLNLYWRKCTEMEFRQNVSMAYAKWDIICHHANETLINVSSRKHELYIVFLCITIYVQWNVSQLLWACKLLW